jgi:hypothetical protein
MREFEANPLRFGTAEYLATAAEHGIALRGDKPVVARCDDGLAGAMLERGGVVHETGRITSAENPFCAKVCPCARNKSLPIWSERLTRTLV